MKTIIKYSHWIPFAGIALIPLKSSDDRFYHSGFDFIGSAFVQATAAVWFIIHFLC